MWQFINPGARPGAGGHQDGATNPSQGHAGRAITCGSCRQPMPLDDEQRPESPPRLPARPKPEPVSHTAAACRRRRGPAHKQGATGSPDRYRSTPEKRSSTTPSRCRRIARSPACAGRKSTCQGKCWPEIDGGVAPTGDRGWRVWHPSLGSNDHVLTHSGWAAGLSGPPRTKVPPQRTTQGQVKACPFPIQAQWGEKTAGPHVIRTGYSNRPAGDGSAFILNNAEDRRACASTIPWTSATGRRNRHRRPRANP